MPREMETLPFYFRDAAYLYTLCSEPAYGWWTGSVTGGRQFLHSPGGILFFDAAGRLAGSEDHERYPIPHEWRKQQASANCEETWPAAIGFEEGPIRVVRFWLPDRWLGIEDMPDGLAEFYTDPGRFEGEPDDVDWWKESGQYVFHAGCGDYYMNRDGGVETS